MRARASPTQMRFPVDTEEVEGNMRVLGAPDLTTTLNLSNVSVHDCVHMLSRLSVGSSC